MSNDLLFFKSFTKGKKAQKFTGSNCVIYTRVPTKEQADNNLSLETQRKACQQYALKSKYIQQPTSPGKMHGRCEGTIIEWHLVYGTAHWL